MVTAGCPRSLVWAYPLILGVYILGVYILGVYILGVLSLAHRRLESIMTNSGLTTDLLSPEPPESGGSAESAKPFSPFASAAPKALPLPLSWREPLAVALLVLLADVSIYQGGGYLGYALTFLLAPVLLLLGGCRPEFSKARIANVVSLALWVSLACGSHGKARLSRSSWPLAPFTVLPSRHGACTRSFPRWPRPSSEHSIEPFRAPSPMWRLFEDADSLCPKCTH